jgi:hypothetical protein
VNRVLKIRLTKELSTWIAESARRTGSAEERVAIRALEKTRAVEKWLVRAGKISGPRDLSSRRGFETR